MRYLLILIVLQFCTTESQAQIFLDFQLNTQHNLGTKSNNRGDGVANRYLLTPTGKEMLEIDSQKRLYSLGVSGAVHVNLFLTDFFGVATGAEYGYYRIGTKYNVGDNSNIFKERHGIQYIGFPIFLKFGDLDIGDFIHDSPIYFIGAQYNRYLNLKRIQKVDWHDMPHVTNRDELEYKKGNWMFFIGCEYLFAQIRFEYSPSYFNRDYIDANGNKPYYNQRRAIFNIRLGINIVTEEY